MRRHIDPKRKTTQAEDNPSTEDPHNPDSRHNRHKHGGAAPVMWRCTRYVAVHPLCGAAPDKGRCTRYVALHPLRGGAPEQKRCIAYGSGAVPQQTRTNAELAHRTTHRRTPPCAPGPYWRQDGHAAHAATCTPAHSNTSHTLKCEEPANRSRPIRVGEDSNKSGGDNADDLRAQTPRGRPCGQPLGVSHQHSASSPR